MPKHNGSWNLILLSKIKKIRKIINKAKERYNTQYPDRDMEEADREVELIREIERTTYKDVDLFILKRDPYERS